MTAVFITVYRQRTLPKINEERSVQRQKNQIIIVCDVFNVTFITTNETTLKQCELGLHDPFKTTGVTTQ